MIFPVAGHFRDDSPILALTQTELHILSLGNATTLKESLPNPPSSPPSRLLPTSVPAVLFSAPPPPPICSLVDCLNPNPISRSFRITSESHLQIWCKYQGADKAAYANIRVAYYKSKYGATKTLDNLLHDATEVYDKTKMPKIPLESFKLGDIVVGEVMLKKYSRKSHGPKNGDFGLSYDLQALALLKACSMMEHNKFQAEKESLATVAAAETAGVVL